MKKKIIISSMLILVASVTLGCLGLSYSWIKRDWAPEFYSNELTVETSGSLAIKLDGDSTTYSEIDLNSVLNLSSFTLKQVSNCTGYSDDFFSIDYTQGDGLETLSYLQKSSDESYTTFSVKNGYIESRFMITCKTSSTDQFTKYVFIDDAKSYIKLPDESSIVGGKYDVSEAVRCSLTIEGLSTAGSVTSSIDRLFRKTVYSRDADGNIVSKINPHVGATDDVNDDGAHIGNGKYIYTLDDDNNVTGYNSEACKTNSDVHEFSDYNGGMVGYNQDGTLKDYTFQESKTLFILGSNDTRWVTIRIWLEGYDENCVDDITGSSIQFKIVFRSHDIKN